MLLGFIKFFLVEELYSREKKHESDDDDDDDDATTARVWGDPVWASLTTRTRELFDGTAPSVLLRLY